MDEILKHVSKENRASVSKLTCKHVANILEALVMIPSVIEDIIECDQPVLQVVERAAPVTAYSDNVVIKGQQGEMEFDEACRKYLPSEYNAINVAKVDRSGDFIIEWSSAKTNLIYKMLVDVKNYNNTVPTKEVEKFHRDIECNQSINCGILLSRNSRICGFQRMFQFDNRLIGPRSVPIIYLNTSNGQITTEAIQFLFHMTELNTMCQTPCRRWNNIIKHVRNLEDTIDNMSRMRDSTHELKIVIERKFNSMLADLMSIEYKMKNQITFINSIIMQETEPEANVNEASKKSIDVNKHVDERLTALSSIGHEYTQLFREMMEIDWSNEFVNDKNEWIFIKNDTFKMHLKFNKKTISATVYVPPHCIQQVRADIGDVKITTKSIAFRFGPETCRNVNYILDNLSATN